MKTLYELLKGRKPNISYFHRFGCSYFILNTKDNLGKFDSNCDSRILLGYFESSKAYKVYNSRTFIVEEAIHVRFNDNKPDTTMLELNESFVETEDITKSDVAFSHNQLSSNLPMDDQPEKVRELTGCLLRKHHLESRSLVILRTKSKQRILSST